MSGGNPTVVFTDVGKVAIEDREIPVLKEDQLLIKTRCTLISTGTELTVLSGKYPPNSGWAQWGKFPFVPGYNNIGEVVDVGAKVDREWIGRKVANYGPHALYVTARIDPSDMWTLARSIPRDVPDDQAVLFALAEVAMNGVRRGGVEWGDAVAVYGAGLVGQLTSRFCRLCGARPVFVIDVADSRLRRLPEDPLIIKLSANEVDSRTAVEKATKGRMASVVFEVTGDPDLIPSEFSVLRGQGRFVVLSSPRGITRFDFHDLCNGPSFTIIGAHNGSHPRYESPQNPWTVLRHFELYIDLLADGELDVAPLISHRESYEKAVELYQLLLRDRTQAMGVVLKWS